MGQCMSRKAVAAFTTTAVAIHQQNYQHVVQHLKSPEEEIKPTMKKQTTKGVATSFGFRKKSPTATASLPAPTSCTLTANNPTAARRLANATDSLDTNGNAGHNTENTTAVPITNDTACLISNAVPIAKSASHRLPAPKKEAQATTKPSRFGFRQPHVNRLNRVADINVHPPTHIEYSNNNPASVKEREKIESEIKAKVEMQHQHQQQRARITDSNRNVAGGGRYIGKYTLQSNNLPRPQNVKLLESKNAKTLANNSKKQSSQLLQSNVEKPKPSTTSGDESYLTEDSGVGSNCDNNIKNMENSPMARRFRGAKFAKPRNLDVVVTRNKFDVCESDNKMECLPVPTLSSLSCPHFPRTNSNVATGNVRERAAEYQRTVIDKNLFSVRPRKNSITSSEASSHAEEEPIKRMEKIAQFIKQKPQEPSLGVDEQVWSLNAGDAMAEELSLIYNSSSDESRCREHNPMEQSIEVLISAKANNRLSFVDPQFAAIAESNKMAALIADEPSPVESINCSSPEEHNDRVLNNTSNFTSHSASTSNSKDVNEKNSPSPESPTNASNSLSLSDGREDFLIDDEIADQPALLFDDTITNSNQQSDATPTIVDSTPKPARRIMGMYESSPLSLKNRRFSRPRAGSLDTLSPCESIASDDCMMDYDLSSGVEDGAGTDRSGLFTLDDTIRTVDLKITNVVKDWSMLLSGCDSGRDSTKRMSFRSSRLLKSRGGTPASSVPDSPRLDVMRKAPATHSPLRLSSRSSTATTGTGYDSDDSGVIRLDRSVLQDVMGLKAGLLKLKRVLHEPATEDYVLRSETHNSLSSNGFFTGYGSGSDVDRDPDEVSLRDEMENLRRQVVYLQGQLDDSERATQTLRQEMLALSLKYESSQSAPASVTTSTPVTSIANSTTSATTRNATTQTERIRPISAGSALLQDAIDLSPGSLVSVSEHHLATPPTQTPPTSTLSGGRSRFAQNHSTSRAGTLQTPSRLWRMPGEPPSPSAIPRRSCSRNRVGNTSMTASSTSTPT